MFWFRKEDNRSVEQLISDIATHKRHSDIEMLALKLAGKQVYAPLPDDLRDMAVMNSGQTVTADGTGKFQWPCVEISNLRFAQCVSGKDNSICSGNAVAMPFEEMKAMISKVGLDGLHIHNGINSWCVIMKDDLT